MQRERELGRRIIGALLGVGLAALVTFAAVFAVKVYPRGGATPNVFAAPGEPLPGIDARARAQFERGRAVFSRRFSPSEGLGPAYNATSCRSCHEKPVAGGSASRYRGVPLEQHSKKTFIAPFEHRFTAGGVDPSRGLSRAIHLPSALFGLGLLAEIPAAEIISRADPSDRNRDGIRGKVNFERGFLGRFGRKAQMASLQGFVRLALLDQMGITTTPVKAPYMPPRDAPLEMRTRDTDGAADPELGQGDLEDLLAFVALLAPPAPDPPTRETRAGEKAFSDCGCAACHVPSLRGPRGGIAAYTDLLLHDMGPELGDEVVVGEAGGRDFRTAPLWGLGAAGPYLHDGRADTLDDAIRAHGGEAAASKQRYLASGARAQGSLLAFLRGLGGSAYREDGLLPKRAPVPAEGEPGGPRSQLSGEARARFERGRDFFDHDLRVSEGLGPFFNGDACRSCHFDPVLGGSGPSDVDVVRHGFLGPDGSFLSPEGGDTMAHRFGLAGEIPPISPEANLFERRQTPALFGAGLIDAIPEEAIRAHADPEDRDGDGIRGVVSVVRGGRVGRFGWKARMASLADCVEDAFRNEMGATRAELSPRNFDDVVFFLAELAPPPRGVLPRELEARGLSAFTACGCTNCHIPEMPTRTGPSAALYSDLLLHEIAAPAERILPDGTRSFRTPPLWGVAASAPYFHDGMSETLEQAILRHDAEAKRSREQYQQMPESDRSALLAFLNSL